MIIIADSYMMFNTASYQHAPLDKGQLISPGLPHSNFTYCMTFWTFMYSSTAGVPIGGLQVKVLKSDNSTINLWRLDNHQASHWVQSQVSMPDHFNVTDRVSWFHLCLPSCELFSSACTFQWFKLEKTFLKIIEFCRHCCNEWTSNVRLTFNLKSMPNNLL